MDKLKRFGHDFQLTLLERYELTFIWRKYKVMLPKNWPKNVNKPFHFDFQRYTLEITNPW